MHSCLKQLVNARFNLNVKYQHNEFTYMIKYVAIYYFGVFI